MNLNKKSIALLAELKALSAEEFTYATVKDAAQLVAAGLAEQNPDFVDSEGRLATRAVIAKVEELMTDTNEIQILKGQPIPARKGGRTAKFNYPFEKLELHDAFDIPKPMKQAASIVSGANKKLGPGMKFTARSLDENTSRVWRII